MFFFYSKRRIISYNNFLHLKFHPSSISLTWIRQLGEVNKRDLHCWRLHLLTIRCHWEMKYLVSKFLFFIYLQWLTHYLMFVCSTRAVINWLRNGRVFNFIFKVSHWKSIQITFKKVSNPISTSASIILASLILIFRFTKKKILNSKNLL